MKTILPGVVVLALLMSGAAGSHAYGSGPTPAARKSAIGQAFGPVVKVHGYHNDCRLPAVAAGTGHISSGGPYCWGICTVPCKMPTSTLKCKDRPACGSGYSTHCVSQPSHTCCLVWAKCAPGREPATKKAPPRR
jgi:hypothetical protein